MMNAKKQNFGSNPPRSIRSLWSDMDSLNPETVSTPVFLEGCVVVCCCSTWHSSGLGLPGQQQWPCTIQNPRRHSALWNSSGNYSGNCHIETNWKPMGFETLGNCSSIGNPFAGSGQLRTVMDDRIRAPSSRLQKRGNLLLEVTSFNRRSRSILRWVLTQ